MFVCCAERPRLHHAIYKERHTSAGVRVSETINNVLFFLHLWQIPTNIYAVYQVYDGVGFSHAKTLYNIKKNSFVHTSDSCKTGACLVLFVTLSEWYA